jgi:hypothetical protein
MTYETSFFHKHRIASKLSHGLERHFTQRVFSLLLAPQAHQKVVVITYPSRHNFTDTNVRRVVLQHLCVVLGCVETVEGKVTKVVVQSQEIWVFAVIKLLQEAGVSLQCAFLS